MIEYKFIGDDIIYISLSLSYTNCHIYISLKLDWLEYVFRLYLYTYNCIVLIRYCKYSEYIC